MDSMCSDDRTKCQMSTSNAGQILNYMLLDQDDFLAIRAIWDTDMLLEMPQPRAGVIAERAHSLHPDTVRLMRKPAPTMVGAGFLFNLRPLLLAVGVVDLDRIMPELRETRLDLVVRGGKPGV